MSHGESHTLKVIRKGKKVEEEIFKSQEEMFERVRELNVKALGPRQEERVCRAHCGAHNKHKLEYKQTK